MNLYHRGYMQLKSSELFPSGSVVKNLHAMQET